MGSYKVLFSLELHEPIGKMLSSADKSQFGILAGQSDGVYLVNINSDVLILENSYFGKKPSYFRFNDVYFDNDGLLLSGFSRPLTKVFFHNRPPLLFENDEHVSISGYSSLSYHDGIVFSQNLDTSNLQFFDFNKHKVIDEVFIGGEVTALKFINSKDLYLTRVNEEGNSEYFYFQWENKNLKEVDGFSSHIDLNGLIYSHKNKALIGIGGYPPSEAEFYFLGQDDFSFHYTPEPPVVNNDKLWLYSKNRSIVSAAELSPDESLLALPGPSGLLVFIEVSSGKTVAEYQISKHDISSVVWPSQDRVVVSDTGGHVQLIQINKFK